MSRTKTVADARRWAEAADHSGRSALERFRKKLDEGDPAYAFEWSAEAFFAAAMVRVATFVLEALAETPEQGGMMPADELMTWLRREAHDRMLRAARHPARSSSPQSNLMEQEIGAAWTSFYEWLTRPW